MNETPIYTVDDEVESQGKFSLEVFGRILAGLKTETYMMTMITGMR